jgi:hypothetical protein
MRMKRKRRVWVWFAALSLVAALAWLICRWFAAAFTEDLYVEKNTFDYFLVVNSRFIKTVPCPGTITDLAYYSSCGDGPKPPANGVEFTTDATHQKLIDDLTAHLQRFGYREWKETDEYAEHQSETDRNAMISLYALSNNLIRVTIREYYYD